MIHSEPYVFTNYYYEGTVFGLLPVFNCRSTGQWHAHFVQSTEHTHYSSSIDWIVAVTCGRL